jgi:cysteine desulfuration protein SufE
MPPTLPTLDEIKEAFAFLDDWEDRYRYIMDLGEKLPPLPAVDRVDANLVHGCQSTVWVVMHHTDGQVALTADSDSSLVKGLAALVVIALQGLSPAGVVGLDLNEFFSSLHLHEHLSPTRSNGLHGMVRQVRTRAVELATC